LRHLRFHGCVLKWECMLTLFDAIGLRREWSDIVRARLTPTSLSWLLWSDTSPLVPGSRSRYDRHMSKRTLHNEFTAIIERDGKWYVGYCPEIPGANL
jgi:hypothetical protein